MKRSKLYKLLSAVLVILMIGIFVLAAGCSQQQQTPVDSEKTQPVEPEKNLESKEYILIGRVNPATGPLAGFGLGTPFIEDKAIEAVNAEGGIYIKEYDKKLPIKIIYADSESNPTKASEAASKLCLQDKVDIIIGSHTPETVSPVASSAERSGIPCVTVDAPGEAWLEGGPYEWCFHAWWKVDSLIDAFFDAFDKFETNKKIGYALGNDTDGVLFSRIMSEKAPERGYTIIDPGRFPDGTKDFTSLISEFKKNGCDIIYGNMKTPDFTTLFKQFKQQNYTPKMLGISKALLFPTDVEAMGENLGEGLTVEVWWSEHHPYKSSITGQSAKELCDMYNEATGNQPSAVIGPKHANIEIVVDALKRAQTLEREALKKAIAETDLDTIMGHIKFDDQNFSETKLVIGQWQIGEEWPFEAVIYSNTKGPEIPVSDKPVIFPLPGATQ